MSGRDEFSVLAFFADDAGYERVVSFVDGKTAVEHASRVSKGVGARLGYVVRIIITDGGDNTVFEWKHGEGVTFPPEARGRQ